MNYLHDRLCSLICLGFYSIFQGDVEKDARKSAFFYDEAATFLNECDKINPEHPLLWVSKGVLIMARNKMLRERHVYESARAHFLFVLERYLDFTPALIGQAEALALNAINFGFSDKGKAQSCYILGKIYHCQANFDDAYAYYFQTTRFDADFVAAHFGLAQLYFQKKDFTSAISALELCLDLCPNQPASLKLISFLYTSNLKDRKKAIKAMKSLLSMDPNDLDTMLQLASLVEQSIAEDAVALYEKSVSILNSSIAPIPIEVLNNFAVLIMEKDPQKALSLLQEAKGSPSLEASDLRIASIEYSIARALEMLGKFQEAIEIYKALIASNSSKQLLSHVRLGLIAMELSDKASSDYFKDAIGLKEACKEAWAGLALLHLRSKAVTLARKTFERILSKIDKHDLFSLLSLGNIHLIIAKHEKRNSQNTWEASLGRAIEFFQKCLMLDSNNYFAVNGLAIAISMKGPTFLAGCKDAFLAIRQEEPGFIDAWINLAHIYVEEQHFAAAQGIYEHCWKKLSTEKIEFQAAGRPLGDREKIISDLMLYIAKSFYLTGKAVKDGTAFLKSIEWLQTINPSTQDEKLILSFNEAIARQEYSACVLQKDINSQSFADVKCALDNLDKAALMLEHLCISIGEKHSASPATSSLQVDTKIARQRIKYCHSLKASAQKQYEQHLDKERQRKESEEQYAKAMAEAELKREEERRLFGEAKKKEEQQIEELRRATRERLAECQAKWKIESQNEEICIKKKKSKKRLRVSLSDEEDSQHEAQSDHEDQTGHQEETNQMDIRGQAHRIGNVSSENPVESNEDDEQSHTKDMSMHTQHGRDAHNSLSEMEQDYKATDAKHDDNPAIGNDLEMSMQ
ncbi:TPR domain-containing protein [Mitosporidium daphniae]|uniref:TPR domain-containing protein n=1 Tax=Mitosporidium daphniae TaxID=1485682 RepID=A0A098VMV6_9MICR|nr:TPR domain-containing protein [Mitosporidium daphniae]KGG50295.1 TPR domain-containing protein [Mitosporidium daphniae]|eukprot:XP_013236738.1 TPR domain-containing protein [Mitosporidium daphniae]